MTLNLPKSWMRFTGIMVAAVVGLAVAQKWITVDMGAGISSIALGLFGVGIVKKMNSAKK